MPENSAVDSRGRWWRREWAVLGGDMSWIHWLVLATSAALTLFAFGFSQRQIQEKNQARFEREVQQVLELVLERMTKYEDGLWGGVGLFRGSERVTARAWRVYADTLNLDHKYPGVNGIGVIRHVWGADALEHFEREQQGEQPGFRVYPARAADEFFPITYIVPLEGNEQALGLDIAHEQNRYRAAREARDTGRSRITGPIVLVQDAGQTPGFLFYAPFYRGGAPPDSVEERRERFLGLVYAPFVVKKLMQGTLAARNRHVRVRIEDAEAGETLFDEHRGGPDDDPAPLFAHRQTVDLFGRPWTFDIRSSLAFRRDAENDLPLTILFGGIAIDGLLFLLFVSLSRARKRALGLADTLQARTRNLERANCDLEDFASAVSHDLRAPLRAIDALADWIEEDCAETLSDTGRGYLRRMRERIGRMNGLLGDMLHYARVGADTKVAEPIDPRELVAEVMEWLAPERQVEVDVQGSVPERVVTSRVEFQLVLRNLIQNAIKHTDRESVRIELGVRQREDDTLVVFVRDDGPGIPPRYADDVFRAFRKLNTRTAADGSGLGLSMVKKVVEARGGWIRLVEKEGRGAEFEIGWRLG